MIDAPGWHYLLAAVMVLGVLVAWTASRGEGA